MIQYANCSKVAHLLDMGPPKTPTFDACNKKGEKHLHDPDALLLCTGLAVAEIVAGTVVQQLQQPAGYYKHCKTGMGQASGTEYCYLQHLLHE